LVPLALPGGQAARLGRGVPEPRALGLKAGGSAEGFLLIVTITFAYVTPWLTGKLTYVMMFQHTVECTGQQILSLSVRDQEFTGYSVIGQSV